MPRLHVVDVSLLHRSNEAVPDGEKVRSFLECLLELEHRIIITPDLFTEYDAHPGSYSTPWLNRMLSKNLVEVEEQRNPLLPFRAAIQGLTIPERKKKEIRKDVRLVEAAHRAELMVLSLDDTMAYELASHPSCPVSLG